MPSPTHLHDLFRSLARSRSVASIHREFDPNRLHGFPLDVGRDLLLIHEEDDFQLKGYVIVRLADITKVDHGRKQRAFQRMLDWEGMTAMAGIDAKIALTSMRDCLASLRELGRSIIIEDEVHDQFLIGRVARLGARSLSVHYFSSSVKWDPKLRTIQYDQITFIRFADNYLNTFEKYLPPVPKNRVRSK